MCDHVDSYPGDSCLSEIDGFASYLSTPDRPGCNPKLCKIFAAALKSHRTMQDSYLLICRVKKSHKGILNTTLNRNSAKCGLSDYE